MTINTKRTYFLYEDNKIKQFKITDVGDKRIVQGYIIGEGKIHRRNVSWLQEDPEKLKKKYKNAIKYYKRFGNKKIGLLSKEFFRYISKNIKKEVIVLAIEKTYDYDSFYELVPRVLVKYIDSRGIVSFASIGWFSNLKQV